MPTLLSDGRTPSTLAGYLRIAKMLHLTGAIAYLEKKAAESPNGWEEEVLADEGQMLLMLGSIPDLPEEGA